MKENYINGEIISPGIARGNICYLSGYISPIAKKALPEEKIPDEIKRFDKTIDSVTRELEDTVLLLEKGSYEEQAQIVKTHILMLKDKGFRKNVVEMIKNNPMSAEHAIEHVLKEIIDVLEESESDIFSARASDMRDIELRLKKHLGVEIGRDIKECIEMVENPVLATKELLPSIVLESSRMKISAFIVEAGTSFSHAAILAKSFGIPVLRIENIDRMNVDEGESVIVDALTGKLTVNPAKSELDKLIKPALGESEDAGQESLPLNIWVNIADPVQVTENILKNTAGIGLYRTEFLFMSKEDFPSEEEQFDVYSSLFRRCSKHPVTIRTLDIGGDKTLPYFSFGRQENPNLGFRAHRIYHYHPEIFINQFKAILRAATVIDDLRVMYPMIETVDDLDFVQGLCREAIDSLKKDKVKFKDDFKQGVLIEVPSAVTGAEDMFDLMDFGSVGTNDLLQYFFAIDRNNANIYRTVSPENPLFIRMLKHLVEVSERTGKELNICGEIAADTNYLPILVGLGFKSISIDPHSVIPVKKAMRKFDVAVCREAAKKCLQARTGSDVRSILKQTPGISYESRKEVSTGYIDEAVDPVCRMTVDKETAQFTIVYDDIKYYFCSKQCRDKFIRNLQGDKI